MRTMTWWKSFMSWDLPSQVSLRKKTLRLNSYHRTKPIDIKIYHFFSQKLVSAKTLSITGIHLFSLSYLKLRTKKIKKIKFGTKIDFLKKIKRDNKFIIWKVWRLKWTFFHKFEHNHPFFHLFHFDHLSLNLTISQ